MSPRIKRVRKVLNPPVIKGFRPFGKKVVNQPVTSVTILYEEYEALRLCDYEMYNHHQSSNIMGVSRPTFTRIYASARQKVARAFVEGMQISIEGGKVYFDSDWFQCEKCKSYFNNPEKEKRIENCPLCRSNQIREYDFLDSGKNITADACEDICVCPECGYEKKHLHGKPCNREVCPECLISLKRKEGVKCNN